MLTRQCCLWQLQRMATGGVVGVDHIILYRVGWPGWPGWLQVTDGCDVT